MMPPWFAGAITGADFFCGQTGDFRLTGFSFVTPEQVFVGKG